jgi:hypothetical protein
MLPDDLLKVSQRSESGTSLKWWRIGPLKAKEDSRTPRKSSQVVIYQLMLGHGKLLGWFIW